MNIAANSTSTSNSSKPSHSTGSSPKVKWCQPEMASPKWYSQVPIRLAAAEAFLHSPVLLGAVEEVSIIGHKHQIRKIVHKNGMLINECWRVHGFSICFVFVRCYLADLRANSEIVSVSGQPLCCFGFDVPRWKRTSPNFWTVQRDNPCWSNKRLKKNG